LAPEKQVNAKPANTIGVRWFCLSEESYDGIAHIEKGFPEQKRDFGFEAAVHGGGGGGGEGG
jgi:hypothetical protein